MTLQLTGEPHEIDNAAYLIAVGSLSVAWSSLELAFDLCVAAIFHHSGQGKSLEKVQSRLFSQKLRYFRSALKKIEVLKPYAKAGEMMADRLQKFGDTRNIILHSMPGHTEIPGQREIARVIPNAKNFLMAQGKINTADVAKLAGVMSKHIMPMAELAQELYDLFDGKTPRES